MIRVFRSLVALACFAAPLAASAQAPQSPAANAKEIERSERLHELDALIGSLQHSREGEAKLRTEIDAIKNDRKKFSQDLLDTAARIRATEAKIGDAEKRLAPLDQREADLKKSLAGREAVLTEVLAALERLGLAPAPALVLQTENTLESVRSAILLGAVIPELRSETEKVASDLSELARVRRDIATERDSLTQSRTLLAEDQRRISALIDERQRQQSESEKALESERSRTQALAKQVETVQDLVSRMESEIAAAARAAEAARREDADRAANAMITPDPARTAPVVPFLQTKGKLALPVIGRKLHEYGAANGLGGTEKGLSLATRPGAQVSAPCDGWIVYAGNFRNYGQLLIINAGGGYHILLAGMERITVDLGQFVLAGEPVAVMGSGPRVAAVSFGSSDPILYVEFRKDGNSIDPSPWWATTEDEKVRG